MFGEGAGEEAIFCQVCLKLLILKEVVQFLERSFSWSVFLEQPVILAKVRYMCYKTPSL